ncbi:hypothetical protein [Mesorhizobium sp. INR15]|uniref:hypothetical protein n=1 Tax=Mesorhizobium sp. INR15 TaxID=2654248 RepID=UPI001896A1EB|nr:hypothetical protein [Mesorhizobium sp. INR15]QPC91474.1 hypothetical protein GA829_13115 [Mesorhizobium sp. INR15]
MSTQTEALRLGDIVETVKGAKFWGEIDSFYKGGWGAVVVATDPGFLGCTHVYPLAQLRRREPKP